MPACAPSPAKCTPGATAAGTGAHAVVGACREAFFDTAAYRMDRNISSNASAADSDSLVDNVPNDADTLVDGGSSLALPQLPGIEVSALGVCVTEDDALTSEACHSLFSLALAMHRASNWVLGDTLLLCERTWGNQHIGSKYEEAAAATGMSKSTLMNIVATCRAFPQEKRHDGLTFTHHMEAAYAKGTSEQRDAALQKAEDEGMSCSALRKALRAEAAAAMTKEAVRAATGENDDRPFGLIDLPTKEEAAKALPIAYELSKAACWLNDHPASTLTEEHRAALVERLHPLLTYARDLGMLP